MSRSRSDTSQHVVVIGLGRFGRSVARTLHERGWRVTAIDLDKRAVAEVASHVSLAAQSKGSDEELLRSLEVDRADVGIVAQGRDVEANLASTLLLKDIGVPLVIARATGDLHAELLLRIGADRIVFPERDEGVRLAQELAESRVDDSISGSPASGGANATPSDR